MTYNNPVIKGFNPDPSICKVDHRFYVITSSFQYFPGVPIYESKDLINWKKIGHCLTRSTQVDLMDVRSSSGVFAATLRHHNGRFFMTTTNNSTNQHFIVWTDDIYGEWSDPIVVEQNGIDPSLLFDNDNVYFTSNGKDDMGIEGIIQCNINIKTGKKITSSKMIWQGSGGRYLEGPHLYHINDYYYLFVSEGGTEYGHMMTYARSKNPYGPFEPFDNNPILTNRNLGGYEIQGVGHGDLVQDNNGCWFIIHLGFRQIGQWLPFHHLGRETFLTPLIYDSDQWFKAFEDGTVRSTFDIKADFKQHVQTEYSFKNINTRLDWYYLRHPHFSHYDIKQTKITLWGSNVNLNQAASPTFIGLKQTDFNAVISCQVSLKKGEGGLTIYMDEKHHYDVALQEMEDGIYAIGRLHIGTISHIYRRIYVNDGESKLIIIATSKDYKLYVDEINDEHLLAVAETRYVSSEVALGFTGVLIGLYAYSKTMSNRVTFTDFHIVYQ